MKAQIFSTRGMSPSDRYEAWRSRDWPSFAPILDSTPPPGLFSAEIETHVFGGATMVCAREITGLSYRRDPARVRRDDLDHYSVMACIGGGIAGEAAGRAFAGGTGSVLIGDLSQPHVHASRSGAATALAIPRQLVDAMVPDMRRQHGVILEGAESRLLLDFIQSLSGHLADTPAESGDRLLQIFLQLLALSVDRRLENGQSVASPSESLAWRARRLIEAELGSQDLTPEAIAARLGTSRSALYRLFQAEDGVAAYVKSRRLAKARAMLSAPERADTISEVAHLCGFSDAQAFRRLFRRTFDRTPSEYRLSALKPDPHG